MGMYTALSLGVGLKKDCPQHVIDVLKYMVGDLNGELTSHPDHHFFNQCSRWSYLLTCDSYYFDWDSGWTFRYDDISDHYYLTGVSNLKNYSNEIIHFLSWLRPYINENTEGFIGWTMYEEHRVPDLIMFTYDGDLEIVNVRDHVSNILIGKLL